MITRILIIFKHFTASSVIINRWVKTSTNNMDTGTDTTIMVTEDMEATTSTDTNNAQSNCTANGNHILRLFPLTLKSPS